MIFLAIATGLLTFFNYYWQANYPLSDFLSAAGLAAQCIFTVLTFAALIRYHGRRTRASYDRAGYRIFTLPFAVIILSQLGNVSVLVVFILHLTGVITAW